jgi:hypothetical protein
MTSGALLLLAHAINAVHLSLDYLHVLRPLNGLQQANASSFFQYIKVDQIPPPSSHASCFEDCNRSFRPLTIS